MEFSVEKTISNFVQKQFPQFYQDEGPNFILFLQAYYEWMESNTPLVDSSNNVILNTSNSNTAPPIYGARNLLDYRDIDNTLDAFLSHFQTKYLYGIPFNVIINQRFLLKHILDVYRSKGSIQCYRLLFKLIYDQDIEVYLPGVDLLRPSDGTWVQQKYIEVSDNGNLSALTNKTIVGITSNTYAVVESVVSEKINKNIVNTIYISNIKPVNASFLINEKIVSTNQLANTTTAANSIANSPIVLGSLDGVKILNGGQNFKIGDTLKIVHRDPTNNQIISFGTGGYLKVTGLTTSSNGQLNINIIDGGFGYTAGANAFIYNGTGDTTGTGATFSVGSINYTEVVSYNTDVIADYLNTSIQAASYNFPSYPAANLSFAINSVLSYSNDTFGTVSSLNNVKTGSGYTNQAYTFVRSTLLSKLQSGTLSYSSTSNTVTGTSTTFTTLFSNNDVIFLQANSFANTYEYQIIKNVVSDTVLTLYGPPMRTAASGTYRLAPSVFPSNFAKYEPIMYRADNTTDGLNANIQASSVSGGNTISTAIALDSGKAYVTNETITAYLYGSVNSVIITAAGLNYSVNDAIIFASSDTTVNPASGYVSSVNATTGAITSINITNTGSGYNNTPNVRVQTQTGVHALLSCTLSEFKPTVQVQGQVIKAGEGRQRGYWSTTKGFLNSDKYIQDSYFYQDYSYQIKVATALSKYKSILYDTFHPAGSELFGEYLSQIDITYDIENLLYGSTSQEISFITDELGDILVLETNELPSNFPGNTLLQGVNSILAQENTF